MGHINIDLSPDSIRYEKELLVKTFDQTGEIPHNHFWNVVYNDYYLNDIRETGNSERFASHHPFVVKIFDKYYEEQDSHCDNSNICTPQVPDPPHAVPEPSAIGIAICLIVGFCLFKFFGALE